MAQSDTRPSDKVRICAGPYADQRAIVERTTQNSVHVRLRDSQRSITVHPEAIVNYSAAARKAWKTMPARSVGRPKGRTSTRRSVTLRLDESLWERFVAMEAKGLIQDRSAFVEDVLDTKLSELTADRGKKANA